MTVAAFSLRRAVAADAPAMWAIRAQAIRETCRSHYPAELLDRWVSSPLPETFPARIENEYFVVGSAGSRVAGFGALNISNGEIEAVFVAPEAGRCGLGRSLLAALEKAAVDAGLKMVSLGSSLNAVPFYQAAGYHAGERGTYMTSQGVEIACVRMSKPLDDIPGR